MSSRQLSAVLSVIALGLGVITAAALAETSSSPRTGSAPASTPAPKPDGKLAMDVVFNRFTVKRGRMSARATANATLTSGSGEHTTTHRSVTFTAAVSASCKILHLRLDQLYLSLLGLNAKLDKVILDVTGNPRGGVLGALFCKLARSVPKVKATRRAEAQIAAELKRHRRLAAVHFTAYLRRQYADATPATGSAAAVTTCPVLSLVVGPLNLELLGLIVDLNKVKLDVTATRGGGKLGDIFCQLADNSTTGTGTTTAAAPAPSP